MSACTEDPLARSAALQSSSATKRKPKAWPGKCRSAASSSSPATTDSRPEPKRSTKALSGAPSRPQVLGDSYFSGPGPTTTAQTITITTSLTMTFNSTDPISAGLSQGSDSESHTGTLTQYGAYSFTYTATINYVQTGSSVTYTGGTQSLTLPVGYPGNPFATPIIVWAAGSKQSDNKIMATVQLVRPACDQRYDPSAFSSPSAIRRLRPQEPAPFDGSADYGLPGRQTEPASVGVPLREKSGRST